MANIARQIAAELETAINGHSGFSESVTASRVWLPEADLKDLNTLRVEIFPGRKTTTRADRKQLEHDQQIAVGIRKRTDSTAIADADAVADLAQELEDFVSNTNLPSYRRPLTIETPILYDPDLLDDDLLFAQLFLATYRVTREPVVS